jgi:uncharacterized protein YlxW (UPF0749 family)
MSLLTEVMNHPLDPGYAAAARRRAGEVKPQAGLLAVAVTLLVAALAGLATTRAVVELRRPAPEGVADRRALEAQIEARTELADRLQQSNDRLQDELTKAQAAGLARADAGDLVAELERLQMATAQIAVTGPGLEITVDDAETAVVAPAGDPRAVSADAGRVLDRDLQILVNGLWAAGAEAVAINRQRLGPLSAIRSAGQAVLVDYRPLTRPYIVQAVGDASRLQSGLARDQAGPYLQALRDNEGIQVWMRATTMTVPAAAGVDLRRARPLPSSGGVMTGGATSAGASPGVPSSGVRSPNGSGPSLAATAIPEVSP